MNKKIASLPSPAIAGVVRESNKRAAIAEIKNCLCHGADMVDLHMSCLDNSDIETLREIIASTPLPVLALNYNMDANWDIKGVSEEERVDNFKRAVEAGAAGVDIQGYTFHAPSHTDFCGEDKYSFTKVKPLEVVTDEAVISKQCEFIEWVHIMDTEALFLFEFKFFI